MRTLRTWGLVAAALAIAGCFKLDLNVSNWGKGAARPDGAAQPAGKAGEAGVAVFGRGAPSQLPLPAAGPTGPAPARPAAGEPSAAWRDAAGPLAAAALPASRFSLRAEVSTATTRPFSPTSLAAGRL